MDTLKKILLVLFVILITACTGSNNQVDFSTWNEDDVYNFLEEVQLQVRELPVETTSRDEVIQQYELYFTPELSKEIVDSLYIQTENGWKIPDGDAGYIFIVPSKGSEESEITVKFTEEYIKIREVYELGMFKEIEYTIGLIDNKPIITEWKRVFD